MTILLHKLNLSFFRGYEALRLETGGARLIAISGPNGAGKTNILEAISLLTPGRGLRRADLSEIRMRQAAESERWAVSAEIEGRDGLMMRLGTGLERKSGTTPLRRVVRVNGRTAKNQHALGDILSAVWLTPQMDRIFLEGPAVRRRFLDRLVLAFHPHHAAAVGRMEKAMRERIKLLQMGRADDRWVTALEARISAESVAVTVARMDLIEALSRHAMSADASRQNLFPQPVFSLSGKISEDLSEKSALQVEENLNVKLKESRRVDAAMGRTQQSGNRVDFSVVYGGRNVPAAQCSTGEQKALLVATVLAHARMMRAEKGFVPLLLLDEVSAHLDQQRRQALFAQLSDFGGQVWLTGTEESIFEGLSQDMRHFHVDQAHISSRGYPKAVLG